MKKTKVPQWKSWACDAGKHDRCRRCDCRCHSKDR